MKTILLPFYDDDAAEAALDVSRQLATRFDSYIEGLFVMRPPQIIDGEGIVLADSYLTQLKEEGRRIGDRARTRFDDCVARRGMVAGSMTEPAGGVVIGWQEMEGLEGQVIGDRGRVFDLIVIGREFGHPWVDWHVMAEAALFESGRPVILAPGKPGEDLGENVVIAWNNSTETARTVAFAMPLLARADTVTIVAVRGWGGPRPDRGRALRASRAQRHLRRRTHHRARRPLPRGSGARRVRGPGRGSARQGRVYPEPVATAHIRWCDPPHHDERADPGHPRALSAGRIRPVRRLRRHAGRGPRGCGAEGGRRRRKGTRCFGMQPGVTADAGPDAAAARCAA